jgi:hypothetical protein
MNMKRPTRIVAAGIIGLALALPTAAHSTPSIRTLTGTIMCQVSHHPDHYSTACRSGSGRYLLVTDSGAYDIKHQGFSGLQQLVGIEVRVTGELKGHVLDILQLMEVPREPNAELP